VITIRLEDYLGNSNDYTFKLNVGKSFIGVKQKDKSIKKVRELIAKLESI
jgi:hypothetical protein